MYFKIGPKDPDPNFSWIIVKNPASTFMRDISSARKVIARFVDDGRWYEGRVTNDPITFLDLLRGMNAASYVAAQLHAVCPLNLSGIDETFRSVLRGKNGAPQFLTDAAFAEPKHFMATMGPFSYDRERLVEVFASVGITATPIADVTTVAYMVEFATIEPMSTTEFLQKLYVVSLYCTAKLHVGQWIQGAQIDKFVALCSTWLDRSSHRTKIIRTLSGHFRSLVDRFEEGMKPDATETTSETEGAAAPVIDYEAKKGLHQRRHELIASRIPITATRIIDLGSADGKLTARLAEQFPEARIIAIDASATRIDRIRRRTRGQKVTALHANILYPPLADNDLVPDVLVCTEVIEHLIKPDRRALLDLIVHGICPTEIIITTPNIVYNSRYEIPAGEFRHPDHKIEYTREEFETEVIAVLRERYDVDELAVCPEEDLQPSFVIHAKRREEPHAIDWRRWRVIRELNAPVYLEMTDWTVGERELRFGLTARPFLANERNIFYLAPTIAPVDHDPSFPDDLEHPMACFNYYRKRGITRLIGEEKYMGSRAHILVFRNPAHAASFGFDRPIVAISRSGLPFFTSNDDLMRVYADIQAKMTSDFMIIDAEVMPWSLKAGGGLIDRDFRIPGEAALLARQYGDDGSIENAKAFLRVLEHFAQPQPLEIRPFHVLAHGRVEMHREHASFTDVRLGCYLQHREQLEMIERLAGGIVQPCAWHEVDLSSTQSMKRSIAAWREFCEQRNGEGFVYKTPEFLVTGPDGYFRQPAMKVRGREYLRIIYGIDYLEPEWFARITHRGTRKKRVLAIQEQDLAIRILRAFLHQNETARRRLVAAFLGMEDVHAGDIDRTL